MLFSCEDECFVTFCDVARLFPHNLTGVAPVKVFFCAEVMLCAVTFGPDFFDCDCASSSGCVSVCVCDVDWFVCDVLLTGIVVVCCMIVALRVLVKVLFHCMILSTGL